MATTSTETSTPTVTISAYSHVNLQITDLERSMDFYCNTMGFEPIPRPDFGGFPGVEATRAENHFTCEPFANQP